jgi:drug/metabolite transporter (DMT)-like permease
MTPAGPGGPDRRRELAGWVAALSAVSMWSGWAVATRGTLRAYGGQLDIADLMALRFLVAGVVVLPIAILYPPPLGRLGAWRSVAAACMGGLTFSLCNTGGLVFAPAAHGGALTAPMGAVITGLLAPFLLGERLSGWRAAGLGLIVGGAVALLAAVMSAGTPASVYIGHALFLGAAVQWSLFIVVTRRAHLTPLESMVLACVGSALIYLPFWLLLRGPGHLLAMPWTVLAVQGLLHGLVAQTLSIVAFNFAVVRLGASRAAACGALVPLLVALGAALFLGEPPTPAELPGLAAISLGVWLAARQRG